MNTERFKEKRGKNKDFNYEIMKLRNVVKKLR